MHGLFCIYNTKEKSADFNLSCFENSKYIRNSYSSARLSIHHVTLNKFINDKGLFENDSIIAVVEGVIVNNHELYEKYHVSCMSDLVATMYVTSGHEFFNEFRGSFCGLLYDKGSDTMYVYNDHIGDKIIYYTSTGNCTLITSDLKVIVDMLQSIGERTTLNHEAVYSLLSYGFIPNNATYITGVRRLLGGHYIKIGRNSIELTKYHLFDNTPNKLTEKENIEEIDIRFRKATQRILSKNKEYGYDNYMPLSAGLDSRMTVWVSTEMTNSPITNFTYSQTNYYDEKTPQSITQYLGNQWIFIPIDGGEYLKKIDETIDITEGLVNYGGGAQTLYALKKIEDKNIGIVATGMLGDHIIRTAYTTHNINQKGTAYPGAISSKNCIEYRDKIPNMANAYPNYELQFIYLRGFLCANMGSPLVFQSQTESYSPFYDTDFLEFVYSISLEQRWEYNIYDKWIMDKYPQAASWAHNGSRKIGKKEKTVSILGRVIPLLDLPKRIAMFFAKKTNIINYDKITIGRSMNPIDSWIDDKTTGLDSFFNEEFEKQIKWIKDEKLKQDITNTYKKGISMEKMQVLTTLSAIRRLGIE